MRRLSFLILFLFAMPAVTFGQAASSDSQTLQALLTEVRQVRQELHISLARAQRAQILPSRLQIEEMDVTRASLHLEEARSKLTEVQVVQRSEEDQIKHLENMPGTGENAEQIQQAINAAKADLEASASVEQERLATKTEAEQQLQTEQAKLNRLEAQLDELVRNMGEPSEQSDRVPH